MQQRVTFQPHSARRSAFTSRVAERSPASRLSFSGESLRLAASITLRHSRAGNKFPTVGQPLIEIFRGPDQRSARQSGKARIRGAGSSSAEQRTHLLVAQSATGRTSLVEEFVTVSGIRLGEARKRRVGADQRCRMGIISRPPDWGLEAKF